MPNPDIFHAHLDVCEQCRENPFALCPTGQKLLTEAAWQTPIPTQPPLVRVETPEIERDAEGRAVALYPRTRR